MDEFEEAIRAMIPKNIDDIIRKNRDQASLSIATLTDIGELIGDIESNNIVDVMHNWHIGKLSVVDTPDAFTLLGDIEGDGSYATSYIKCIDFKRQKIMTKNSIYLLGEAGEGEPHQDQLIALCAYLHNSRAGAILGVPCFFY